MAEFLDDPAASVGGGSNASRRPLPCARRVWNRALCQCLAAAYGAMVGHARVAPSPELPADTFYAMWPLAERVGLPAPPPTSIRTVDPSPDGRARARASSAKGKGHPVAELVLYPVYKELVDQPLFRSLGSRALVKASDGYFLPAGFAVNEGVGGATWAPRVRRIVADRGQAPRRGVHRSALPGARRPRVAQAGARGCGRGDRREGASRLVAPSSAAGQASPRRRANARELVECACSDIDPGPVPGPGTSAPPSPSRQGTIPAMFGHARRPAGDGPPGGDAIDGIMSVVNEMFGQAGIAPPSNAALIAASTAGPPLDLSAVRDLSGVPVPTASGARRRWATRGCTAGAKTWSALRPRRLRGKFLHPALTTSPTIGALVRHAQFRSALRVSVFTPAQLATELPNVLPRRLTHAGCGARPS